MTDIDIPAPPSPRPAVPISRPASTGDTVFVACKLPSGVQLRVFTWHKYMEPMRDGSFKEMRRAMPIEGQQFVVKGPWVATAGQAYNRNSAVADLLPGGYAITEGCPKDIWDGWYEQNKESALVQNGIIFAHKDRGAVINEVRKRSSILTGLEPLNRDNPGEKMGGIDRRLRFGVLEQGPDTGSR